MLNVLCYIMLISNTGVYDNKTVPVKGAATDTDKDVWTVDITDFLKSHKEYTEYNMATQHLNSNDCAILP